MLSSLFGILSAISWGAGDFVGGAVSRKAGAFKTAFYGELAGLILLSIAQIFVREPWPGVVALLWAAAAGVLGSAGLLLLFRALSEGQMSVAAPVSALMAAVLPVIASALTEGLPGPFRYAGFALALVSIWLISQAEGHQTQFHLHLADLRVPLFSGVLFGFYFILMNHGSQTSTLWPMIAARVSGVFFLFWFALAKGQAGLPDRHILPLVVLNAAGDTGGNTFYILAGQSGRLDVAAVLGSLYPGMTVLLAGLILQERLNRAQWLGIAAALAAIILMTI
jgi:drug/metabolite transporter (DMT)-like permease